MTPSVFVLALLLLGLARAKINQSNTGVWHNNTLPNTPSGRIGASAVTTDDNIWIVFGGMHKQGSYNDLYALDLKDTSNGWTKLNARNPPSERGGHSSVLINNRIYVFGGITGPYSTDNAVYELDITNKQLTWTKKTTSNAPKNRNGHVGVSNQGKMYIFGGSDTNSTLLNDLHEYDPATNKWRSIETTNKPTQRYGTASSVYDNKLYIFGGLVPSSSGPGKSVNDTWCLDLTTFTWTEVKTKPSETGNYPSPRHFSTYATAKEDLWIFGGATTEHHSFLGDMWVLSHEGNTWSEAINIRPEITPEARYAGVTTISPGTQAVNVLGGAGETFLDDGWFFIVLQ
jgi:N-acetylneuraminic acid mutarotase